MKFRKYQSYKSSDKIWLGDIPQDWKIKRIKHNTYVKGRIGWQGLRSDEFIDEGPYLITGTDFYNGSINWDSCYHVSESRYNQDPYIQIHEGDLLITKDGTIGKIAIARRVPYKACLNSGIFLTRPTNKDYHPEFLYWLLKSDVFTRFIDYMKSGTTISHLYQNVFVEFSFPIPTKPEQLTIIDFLYSRIGRINSLIEKKQRQIELLQEKRSALISHAVTKGLDPDVKMKDSGIEWLGAIPKDWDIKSFKREAYVITGYAFSSGDFIDNGIPLLRIGDIQADGSINLHNCKLLPPEYASMYRQYIIRTQDLVMAMTGATIGKVGQYMHNEMALLNQRVCIFRAKKGLHHKYLWYILNSNFYKEHIALTAFGGAQPNISDTELLNCHVPIPSLPEQISIASLLDAETSKIDLLTSRIKLSINLLYEYRSALISAAVIGKIDIREEVA